MSTTLTITANSGDCWCNKPSVGTFDNFSANLDIGAEGSSGDDVTTWIPFTVPVSNGKLITSATLRLTATATASFSVDVGMGCEAADNPPNPANLTDLRSRVLSAAYTDLNMGDYVLGNSYTYDVTASVQEIINRAGWPSGGTVAILIVDRINANPRFRQVASSRNGTYTKPQLIVVLNTFIPSAGVV